MKPLAWPFLSLLVLLPACEAENTAVPTTPSSPAPVATAAPIASSSPAPIPPLALSCQAQPRGGDTPLTVRFTAFASGGTGTYDYVWDFGDGSSSTAPRPAHTYVVPGVHAARLVLTSGDEVRQCERPIAVTGAAVARPSPPPGATAPPDLVITIVGLAGAQSYSPNPAVAQVGQRILWRNGDTMAHTATANAGAFHTGVLGPGATSAPATLTAAGTFPYACALHFGMTGSVVVTP